MAQYSMRSGGATARANSYGGQLASFVATNGREMIWQGDPAIWADHSPVLFPIVGSAVEDTIHIEGTAYPMGKHGFARPMDFQLARKGEDFVELSVTATEETRQRYPFDFTLTIAHHIRPEGFTTAFIVDNHSSRPMPMCIGGHPGFICPMEEGEAFEDYVLEFEHPEDGENSLAPGGYIITGKEILPELAGGRRLPLKHAYFDEKDALILTCLRSHSVKLIHQETGKGLRFDFPKFDVLGVWSKPGVAADYVCLEPWSGTPALQGESGNMEDKPYVKILPPGESYATSYSVQVIE